MGMVYGLLGANYGGTPYSTRLLASPSFFRALVHLDREGTGQLLTPYHHLLTRAPTVLPWILALRFQLCHPRRKRLYTTPWTRGIMTWYQVSLMFLIWARRTGWSSSQCNSPGL